jgi:hypothetical protein
MAEEAASMRRKRSLIAVVVALALLVGVYVFLSNRPQEEEPAPEAKPTIDISRLDRNKIVKVTLNNNSKDKEIIFEKETIVVEDTEQEKAGEENKDKESSEPKTETVWKNTTYIPVKLNQSKVEDLTRSFSALSAEVLVEESPKDLSIYGLDKPAATGTALLEDGTEVVLLLGNKTAQGNTYYMMKQGDPKVYTVWSHHGERLSASLAYYRDKSLPDINLTELSYLHISGEGREEMEVKRSDDLDTTEAQYGLGIFQLTKPYKRPRGIDTSKLDPKLEGLARLEIKDFADDQPADLSKYGLDNPKLRFIIKDNETTLDLSFGDTLEDGTIYFKTADSDSVYTMDKALMEFMDIKPMDVADKFALIVNIETVDKVVVEGKGASHTLTITRKTEKAKEEGKEDEVISTYFMDGQEKKEKAFKDFYQSLIGIVVDAQKNHTAQGQPDLKITYYLNKGPQRQLSVEFIPYDRDFYSVVRDGDMESEFLTYRNRLDWVFSDLQNLKENKERPKD